MSIVSEHKANQDPSSSNLVHRALQQVVVTQNHNLPPLQSAGVTLVSVVRSAQRKIEFS